MDQQGFRHPILRTQTGDDRTVGQRTADTIARRAGSWSFIFGFFAFVLIWMLFNGGRDSGTFDPYPYILLNLCLSCLAAIQAPVILMSQNRVDEKRNALAELDFALNRRAEAENRVLARLLGLTSEEFTRRVSEELRGELMTDREPPPAV